MVRDIRSTPLRYGLALGAIANLPISQSPILPITQSPIGNWQSAIAYNVAGCFPVAANKELDDVFTP